jgi:hypothetical protein
MRKRRALGPRSGEFSAQVRSNVQRALYFLTALRATFRRLPFASGVTLACTWREYRLANEPG